MFLDHFISLTDLRCKTHVMNHANRLAHTLLISPFISFILYRDISRVIGLMPDKRLETQSFCLPFAACNCIALCECERTSPWQYFTLQARRHAGSTKNLFARDLPYGESLLNIPPGIKRILKGWCARGRRKKKTHVHACALSLSGQVCAAYINAPRI